MEKIGLLIESKDGRVKKANFSLATLARGADKSLCAFVVNASAAEARSALAPYGVRQIIAVNAGGSGTPWNPAVWAKAVAKAMDRFGVTQLLGLTTPQGRDLLPRIAANLDASLIMDCIEIDLDRKMVRTTHYSGKTIATIQMHGRHFIYGLRPNTVEPQQAPVDAELLSFDYAEDGDEGLEVLETRSGGAEFQNLAEADVILSGGRGLKNGENFKALFDCARLIPGAAVGASRVAVDAGWVPYRMQVGQTGVKVNPKVYIACGISGSVQHFAGMKSSGIIIAINTDPHAAIMSNCDYFAVADLFEVLSELTMILEVSTSTREGSS
jgi:electron transfer flavoprotein alpha subunit